MRGTRVATSKLEYLAHSPCSPNDHPATGGKKGNVTDGTSKQQHVRYKYLFYPSYLRIQPFYCALLGIYQLRKELTSSPSEEEIKRI